MCCIAAKLECEFRRAGLYFADKLLICSSLIVLYYWVACLQ